MRSKLALLLVAAALLLSASAPLLAADATVLRVVVVNTDNPDAYLKEVEKGRAHNKRLEGSSQIRVWRARFAGEEAGTIVVSIEYPSLAALAKDDAKSAADAEFQAWLKGLDKVRKIVSDSLYTELKP